MLMNDEKEAVCKFCGSPLKHMQVKGGGKYGSASIVGDLVVDRLVVHGYTPEGKTFRASVLIKRCPMCGRRVR